MTLNSVNFYNKIVVTLGSFGTGTVFGWYFSNFQKKTFKNYENPESVNATWQMTAYSKHHILEKLHVI